MYNNFLSKNNLNNAITISNNDDLQKYMINDEKMYDIIIIVGLLGYVKEPIETLKIISKKLSINGEILLYCENRLGLNFFCGELDPITHRFGNSIENYVHSKVSNKLYDLDEYIKIINLAGFKDFNTYSVLPSIYNINYIVNSDYKPNELMSIRYQNYYKSPKNIFLDEEYILDSLFKNNMMPQMSNGLLFHINGDNKINELIIFDDRKKENSHLTVLYKNNKVEKISLYEDGNDRIENLNENLINLRNKGIKTIDGKTTNVGGHKSFVSKYYDLKLANDYLKELFFNDREKFVEEVDKFRDLILQASNIIEKKDNVGDIAYLDMVPLNAFYDNGEYIFFDQEFTEKNYPLNAIIVRSILIIYELDINMETILPKKFFYDRYGLTENIEYYYEKCSEFTDKLITRDISKCKNQNAIFDNRNMITSFGERHKASEKKYHIGYVAGVFDLFHVGHLNIIKKAKEMCDYLIVGVVTDEGVRDFKKVEPYIKFEDRCEILRGIKYIDRVVRIPYLERGTKEAYEMYHFDVQVSGSDYENEPLWLSNKKWLEERGSEMVFVPYTSNISTTKIKNNLKDNNVKN